MYKLSILFPDTLVSFHGLARNSMILLSCNAI